MAQDHFSHHRTPSLTRRSRPQCVAAALAWALTGWLLSASPQAGAQTPPSASEVAAYQGLHAAAARGDVSAIKRMVANTSADRAPALLNARDPQGRTPLQVATFARQREAIRALAQAGADMDVLENDRYDAVTIAAVADDEDSLRLLLSLGARPGQITSRYDGNALIAAAHLGHEGIVRQLIAAKAPLDHVNNLHWTALIESIVLGDGGPRHQATLQALLQAGASQQLSDRQGNTPLQLARQRGYTAMVQQLEAAAAR